MKTRIESRKKNDNKQIKDEDFFVKKSKKMSKLEHTLTLYLIEYMNVETECDYSLSFNCETLTSGKKVLVFPENYVSIDYIDRRTQQLFRPFKSERHANVLINLFECLYPNHIDYLETEYNESKGFNGYFVCKGDKIKETEVFGIYTSQILKCVCVAKGLMEIEDFNKFLSKVLFFMRNFRI